MVPRPVGCPLFRADMRWNAAAGETGRQLGQQKKDGLSNLSGSLPSSVPNLRDSPVCAGLPRRCPAGTAAGPGVALQKCPAGRSFCLRVSPAASAIAVGLPLRRSVTWRETEPLPTSRVAIFGCQTVLVLLMNIVYLSRPGRKPFCHRTPFHN